MIDVKNLDGRIITINTDNPTVAVAIAYVTNLRRENGVKEWEYIAIPSIRSFDTANGGMVACGQWYAYADGRKFTW